MSTTTSSASTSFALELLQDPARRPLIFASFTQVVLTYVFFLIGLLPYVPLSYDVFSIPAPTTAMRSLFSRYAPQWVASVLHSPALWQYLRSRGVAVFGWVLNSETCFEEAAQWPLDGVMTDDVPLLAAFFETHPTAFLI